MKGSEENADLESTGSEMKSVVYTGIIFLVGFLSIGIGLLALALY